MVAVKEVSQTLGQRRHGPLILESPKSADGDLSLFAGRGVILFEHLQQGRHAVSPRTPFQSLYAREANLIVATGQERQQPAGHVVLPAGLSMGPRQPLSAGVVLADAA